MAKIQIYARVRPTKHYYQGLHVLNTDCDSDIDSTHHIQVSTGELHDSIANSFSKTPSSKHNFTFKHVFDETANQEQIFKVVAQDMTDSFLEGFNGTIFAYGQTSSGKTHTIEGSGRRFSDRGLIPRTLSYIYKEIEKRGSEEEISVHISYMEIYQDTGYDLLNPGMRPGCLMVEIPKVQVAEGSRGEVFVRNLSTHLAASEEVAQSLLFQGSTCRKVAETSMNQCSSRSHTIFSIMLTAKSPGSEVITKSKLNLVDLAGSERVAKTGADGRVLQEAKHINLSLHHLEHVIVTLQQQLRHSTSNPLVTQSTSISDTRLSVKNSRSSTRQSNSPRHDRNRQSPSRHISRSSLSSQMSGVRRSESGSRMMSSSQSGGGAPVRTTPCKTPPSRGMHIPYRNCMLTMVLKDSLGGNCLTAMIATVSAEERNLNETISTCRFSQRVACISNKARRNEELDDKVVIKKLKQRIMELQNEVEMLKENDHQVSDYDMKLLEVTTQQRQQQQAQQQVLTDSDRALVHQVLHNFFHGHIDNPVTAGIDTPGKFKECLSVLKTIVLYALGIGNDTQPPNILSNSNPLNKLSNEVKVRMGVQSPEEQDETLSTTAHFVERSPKEVNVLQVTTTTSSSPHSRLSSGFGSLHDEDCSESYSSSAASRNLRKKKESQSPKHGSRHSSTRQKQPKEHKKQPHKSLSKETQPDHQSHIDAVPQISDSSDLPNVSRYLHKRPYIENAWTTPARDTTSPPHIMSHDPTQSQLTSNNDYFDEQMPRVSEKIQVKKLLSPRQHVNVVTSPPFSAEGQTHSPWMMDKRKVTTTTSTSLTTKPLSPRDEKAVRKLVQRQVELQVSKAQKNTLANEVNTLDLKVKEEKLREELQHVGELLAKQHVHVSKLQQSRRGADPEQLCVEKIAEQQLRIKQAKLHQKLLDTHYHYKELQNLSPTSTSRPSNPLSPPTAVSYTPPDTVSVSGPRTIATTNSTVPQSPPPNYWTTTSATTQVQSEIAKHELRQSKVQQQIEKLRVSQMEKQLELKEATTRRKILALKQQLLQGNGGSTQTTQVLHERNSTTRRREELASPTSNSLMTSSAQSAKRIPTHVHSFGCEKAMPREDLERQQHSTLNPLQTKHPSTSLSARSTPLSSTLSSEYKDSHVSQLHKASVTDYNELKNESHSSSQPVKARPHTHDTSTTSTLSTLSTQRPVATSTPTKSAGRGSISSSEIKKHTILPIERQTKQLQDPVNVKTQVSQSQSFSSPATMIRDKLTLPEEIKETEYMTAIQRQKARVSRIRRCIVAATVIQRAWRTYKNHDK